MDPTETLDSGHSCSMQVLGPPRALSSLALTTACFMGEALRLGEGGYCSLRITQLVREGQGSGKGEEGGPGLEVGT